jgi:tetratricopeptide (TPR) repeat protein
LRKEVIVEIAPALADLNLKQERYFEAIPLLEDAIGTSIRKNDQARYSFIIGQIYQMDGQHRIAIPYFEYAKKKATDFNLKFMSELSIQKNSILAGGRGKNDASEKLNKMLKEFKYKEFQDQLYYALAEVELTNGNVEKGTEYLKKSIESNKNSSALKAECYYLMADIMYDKPDYVSSKLYYDSTKMVLNDRDQRFPEVAKRAEQLRELADNIQAILKQDSLLALAELPKEELEKIAKKKLKEEMESGQKAGNMDSTPGMARGGRAPIGGIGAGGLTTGSSFFAYNPITVESQRKNFQKSWGNVKLEDNWRRSNKSINLSGEEEILESEAQKDELADISLSDADFKRIMGEVPLTLAQKDRANTILMDAMLNAGKLYREKVSDYEKSVEVLEELLRRFKYFEKEDEALYYLFHSLREMGNTARAEEVKRELIKKFPESKFSRIITDPNYVKNLLADAGKLEKDYDTTYELYTKGQYSDVVSRIQKAFEEHGDNNKMAAKFSLLNAMSLGHTDGDEAYQNSLRELIVKYPNSPEQRKAAEILRFLTGDAFALDVNSSDDLINKFVAEDDKRHYVAVVLLTYEDEALQRSKIAASEYCKAFHKMDRLQFGEAILSKEEETQLILVRSFDNLGKALDFYNGVIKNKEQFISSSIAKYDAFPITQRNYREMLRQKTHRNYKTWFEQNKN